MTTRPPGTASPIERALQALEKMEAKLLASEAARTAPLAIVGIGCRLPGGAGSPASLWQALRAGVDAVRPIPPERWAGGPSNAADPRQWAGILDDIAGFDAAFFGLTPREASAMDPQHRLLLEVAWEALEDAGLVPERLAGGKVGVFVGISSRDYLDQLSVDVLAEEPFAATGNGTAFAAGRIAHLLGLRGPALCVDTACSSALVAVHLACNSLRRGESDLALAGGVNILLSPQVSEQLASLQILSRDGKCRTFDAGASGFVRAEGCGVVALKRLSDAQRDADRIWAVIRGSAVTHNGGAASLTAPSLQGQLAVLRAALEEARIPAARVGYVEVHSNGSPLGDPIEFEALKETVGQPRADGSRCVLGSVKTNLGHAEAASGMASLVKAALVLNHEIIPPNLHFHSLNPHISLEGTPFVLPERETAWPRGGAPRIAGVSSTGLSGTSAHLTLEEPPPLQKEATPARPAHLLLLSARTAEALRAQVTRYLDHLRAATPARLGDICHTAAVGRTHFEHRLALVAASPEQASQNLAAFLAGEPSDCIRGHAPRAVTRRKVAFLFANEASEQLSLDPALHDTLPALREAVAECEPLVHPILGRPLSPFLFGPSPAGDPREGDFYHFVRQYALARVFLAWGVAPSAVVGQGVGEYVAACIAGVFRLEDALALVAARRSPAETEAVLSRIRLASPRLALLPGAQSAEPPTAMGYWKQLSRAPERAAVWLEKLTRQGCVALVRMGPPSSAAPEEIEQLSATRQEDRSSWEVLLAILGRLHARGVEVDWNAFDKDLSFRRVALPTYPFQHERHWLERASRRVAGPDQPEEHPLLGRRLVPFAHQPDLRGWSLTLDPARAQRLGRMRVAGLSLLSLGALLDLAQAAGREEFGEAPGILRLSIDAPALLERGDAAAQVIVRPNAEGSASFEIFSRTKEGAPWQLAGHGALAPRRGAAEARAAELPQWELFEELPAATLRRGLALLGIAPDAPALEQAWRRDGESVARLSRGGVIPEAAAGGLVQAAAALASLTHAAETGAPWIAQGFDRLRILARGQAPAWMRLSWLQRSGREAALDIVWFADDGKLLAEARALRLAAAEPFEIVKWAGEDPLARATFERTWVEAALAPHPAAPAPAPRHFLVLADRGGVGEGLVERLRAGGHAATAFSRDEHERAPERLGLVLATNRTFSDIVHLFGLDPPRAETSTPDALLEAQRVGPEIALELGMIAVQKPRPPRMWFVTRGAEPLAGAPAALEAAPLRGLGRALAREHPGLWAAAIDLDGAPDSQEIERLAAALAAPDDEDQIAFRGGRRLVPRVARPAPLDRAVRLVLRPDRAYLVTGGLSALGLIVARRLVERGARLLVLSSRAELPPRAEWDRKDLSRAMRARIEAVRALEVQGAEVRIEAVDVAERAALAEMLERLGRPLGGVIHAAGAGGARAPLLEPSTASLLEAAFRSRILGSLALHDLTQGTPLDFFVLIASTASIRAQEGRGYEAPADHFMDALAQHRRANGLPALCFHAPPPGRAGPAGQDALAAPPNETLLDALERAIGARGAERTIAMVDGELLAALRDAGAREPLFADLLPPPSASSPAVPLPRRLALAGHSEARRLLRESLRAELASLLGRAPSTLRDDEPLIAQGVDSIVGVQLTSAMGKALGRTVPASALLSHPTLDSLAGHLVTWASPDPAGAPRPAEVWHYTPLVPFRRTGARWPFFCVHPIVGIALVYQPLATHLGDDQPFYGLQARGVEGDDPPLERIEEMAALYLQAVREVQPRGPYRIGGYSFGTYVAFEMAQQLTRAGEEVERLVLMDAPAFDVSHSAVTVFARWLGLEIGDDVARLPPEEQMPHFSRAMARLLLLPPDIAESRQQLRVQAAHMAALVAYRFAPYAGRITLLRAMETVASGATALLGPTFGWGALCREPVDVHDIPGNHFNAIIEPRVRELAAILRRVLAP